MSENPRPSWPYLAIGALSYPVLRLVFRERWQGLERLPADGGYVLAANHLSNADPWPLGMALFPKRYLRFMAKSELFWFPLGPFISACGAFPVRRGEHDLEAVETAIRLCREGHIVVIRHARHDECAGIAEHREQGFDQLARAAADPGKRGVHQKDAAGSDAESAQFRYEHYKCNITEGGGR